MTDAPQRRVEKFCALVLPALEAAGYTGYGSQQRLVADTGMSSSTISRLIKREQIPHVKFFPRLAEVAGLDPVELLVAAEVLPPEYLESQQTLSETKQSQVGSGSITPEEAAERLGIHDDVGRFTFFAVVDKLTEEDQAAEADQTDTTGGATAQA
ncbi:MULTISPECIES: helix-turn-helix transcriptional regulator [unclassified Streptomyces]|uniref:helix-turn-helix transcriptional regulator n=1 Tax=unclassified Streptomyces TaxID=2593676 RepID=UPI002E16FB56|nr:MULTISPECIES: helix-turn-helix transcriptional regulator [unclassified Streptomyces]